MALTNKVYPPYQFEEFPKEVKGKIVYSKAEEDELLGVNKEEDDGIDHSQDDDAGDTDKEGEDTKESLQAKADELGVKYRPTWGVHRLRKAIEEAKE